MSSSTWSSRSGNRIACKGHDAMTSAVKTLRENEITCIRHYPSTSTEPSSSGYRMARIRHYAMTSTGQSGSGNPMVCMRHYVSTLTRLSRTDSLLITCGLRADGWSVTGQWADRTRTVREPRGCVAGRPAGRFFFCWPCYSRIAFFGCYNWLFFVYWCSLLYYISVWKV